MDVPIWWIVLCGFSLDGVINTVSCFFIASNMEDEEPLPKNNYLGCNDNDLNSENEIFRGYFKYG